MCTVRQAIYIVRAYSIQRIYTRNERRNELSTKGGHTNFFFVRNSQIHKFLGSLHYRKPQIYKVCQSANCKSANFQAHYTIAKSTGRTPTNTYMSSQPTSHFNTLLVAWQRLCRTHARIRGDRSSAAAFTTDSPNSYSAQCWHTCSGFPPTVILSVNTLTVPNRLPSSIAAEIGAQLASTADPDKAFAPCTAVVVLQESTTTLFPLSLPSLSVMIDREGPQSQFSTFAYGRWSSYRRKSAA